MGDEFYKKLHVCNRKALYFILQRVPINETFSPQRRSVIGNNYVHRLERINQSYYVAYKSL